MAFVYGEDIISSSDLGTEILMGDSAQCGTRPLAGTVIDDSGQRVIAN